MLKFKKILPTLKIILRALGGAGDEDSQLAANILGQPATQTRPVGLRQRQVPRTLHPLRYIVRQAAVRPRLFSDKSRQKV